MAWSDWKMKRYQRAYQKRYRKENLESLRAKERKRQRERYIKGWCSSSRKTMRRKVLHLLGGKCIKCKFSDSRALHIDHINGCPCPSSQRSKHGESGMGLLRKILNGKKDISKYQILCANCNWIKRFENGEHGNYKNRRKSS